MTGMMACNDRAFHVLVKPTGPLCNLDCTYCFYLEKEKLFPAATVWQMPDDVLESFIRQYIESQDVPAISFAWQGGEPTLLGVEFFRRVVTLQQKHAGGKTIENALQTNGVLLDDRWCEFFAGNRFLVGLSIDGPREIHDRYRMDRGGNATFDRVMCGLERMKQHQVQFNTLTCVQRDNARKPLEVYRFLKQVGSGFIQLIPVVERIAVSAGPDDLRLVAPAADVPAAVSEWSVLPDQFGSFLCAIFDEWVHHDVGRTFVQLFDVALESWVGLASSLCVFAETCGSAMALEHNGDLYSCDHYVYPENKLGNIMEAALTSMVQSVRQRQFGIDKRETLPRYCKDCDVLFACNGECPKHRFMPTPDGERGWNYLCSGYRTFFRHIDPCMRFMAAELAQERAPANVMAWLRQKESRGGENKRLGRNEACLCGSGRKYKKCCGLES
jgi:uncharacterized protein